MSVQFDEIKHSLAEEIVEEDPVLDVSVAVDPITNGTVTTVIDTGLDTPTPTIISANFPSGKKCLEWSEVMGIKHGSQTIWMETKMKNYFKRSVHTYNMGVLDGPWMESWDNGKERYNRCYRDGKKDGEWREYTDNGELLKLCLYNSGVRVGTWKMWHNEVLTAEYYYKDGEQTGYTTYSDEKNYTGKKIHKSRRDKIGMDAEDNMVYEIHESYEQYYKTPNNVDDNYKPQMESKKIYLNRKQVSDTVWYENGRKKLELIYIDNSVGIKEYFDSEDNNIKLEGQMMGILEWVRKKTGEWKFYHTNGQLQELCTYVNDRKNGYAICYFDDGHLHSEDFYQNGKVIDQPLNFNDKTKFKTSDKNCMVCYDLGTAEDRVIALNCRVDDHTFHVSCIKEWLAHTDGRPKCSLCRMPIK